jgi:hypothetical protein
VAVLGLSLAIIKLAAPLALDGEAAAEGGPEGAAIAAVSVVSLVLGYLVLFALWRYVFSAKARARRGEPPD